ncbi:hypothetical protein INT47_011653, partial [Mucor saturninus]
MPTYDIPMLNYTSKPIDTTIPLASNQNYQSNSASNRQKTNLFQTTNLKIGSLNCRSLALTSYPSTRRKFTRYFRSLKYDLISFQEVRTKDSNILDSLNMELQAKDSIWTQHVGIVNFNPNIRITPIFITHTKHAVFVQVHHINHHLEPIFLLNLYAPSQPSPKKQFYNDIIELPLFKDETDIAYFTKYSNFMITGDFNYHHYTSYRSSNSPSPHPIISWKQIISQHLYDCINSDDSGKFTHNHRLYFASLTIKASITTSGVNFINTDWTDHALLSIDLVL